MYVLVACEESQEVCKAFRERGHIAFSCDIQECSGGHPEWHIKMDVTALLHPHKIEWFYHEDGCYGYETKLGYEFTTMDGIHHKIVGKWDMIIAFPPCTHLAISGSRHFEKKRADGRQREGIELFCKMLNADTDKLCVENPVNIISGTYVQFYFPDLCKKYGLPIKPTQHIQPYEFGHHARKKTCLWLKGLKPLTPTNIVKPELVTYYTSDGRKTTYSKDYCIGTGKDRGKSRSKTYTGVAQAMAEQWGGRVYQDATRIINYK